MEECPQNKTKQSKTKKKLEDKEKDSASEETHRVKNLHIETPEDHLSCADSIKMKIIAIFFMMMP